MRPWRVCLITLVTFAATAAARGSESDDTKLARMHYDEGVRLMASEAWEQATDEFRGAIKLDPHMVLAHYNLGQSLMALKRFDDAVRAYRACKEAFGALGSLSEKERGDRERQRRDELQELRDSLLRLHTLKNVNTMQYETRMDDRIRLLESMVGKDTQHLKMPAEFPLALGSAYFRAEKLPDAEREYLEAIQINPKLGAAHNNLAVILLLTGRAQDAGGELQPAEKNGFHVNANLKRDVERARAGQTK